MEGREGKKRKVRDETDRGTPQKNFWLPPWPIITVISHQYRHAVERSRGGVGV